MGACASVAGESISNGTIIIVRSRLPVDGLHTSLKVAGWTEFPFANDSPDDRGSTNGSSYGHENDDRVLRDGAAAAW